MNKTLGGVMIVANGKKYDYPFVQTVECLLDLCDKVSIICFNKEDFELLPDNPKLNKVLMPYGAWENTVRGKERIAYWQNIARNQLKTDYYFSLQADEILHEDCFEAVRLAMAEDKPGFSCLRFNLWGSPSTFLNVPPANQPCNILPVRLTKLNYDSVGDGESINAPFTNSWAERIRIYHMGFVRDKKVHNDKIVNMQENVFELGGHDVRCDDDKKENNNEFRPWTRYAKSDVQPIQEMLPKYIKTWAEERA